MFIRREEYNSLQERIAKLKAELAEERRQCVKMWTEKSENFLKDYQWAVLLPKDSYVVKVWNQDRFEEGIREVECNASVKCFPELNIRK